MMDDHTPLGRLAVAHYGKALKEADRDGRGSHPVYGSSGEVGRHTEALIEFPTIVIGRKGSVGKVTYAPQGGWPIDTAYYLELLDPKNVDLRYLYWALRHARLDRRTITTSIPGLNRDELYRTRVFVPPVAEQRRIAAMLDKGDAVQQKQGERMRLLGELLRSTFLEMFGDPVRNEKRWEMPALSAIAEVERGRFTPRPRNDPQFYGGDYPFIQTGDIANSTGLLSTWRQTLNENGVTVSRRFPRGTIAIAIAANIGDTAIIDFDFFCPDSVVGIVPNADVLPDYLEFALRFFRPALLARAPMTAQRNINLGVLRPMRVPVPPVELQQRFREIRRAAATMSACLGVTATQLELLSNSIEEQSFGRRSAA